MNNLEAKEKAQQPLLVVGLGAGDEGKGSIINYLTRPEAGPTGVVVRYNGGAQAAHNVVTEDGRHHTFAQFGSGTLNGWQTYLSSHMLVNPITLLNEAEHLKKIGVSEPLKLLTINSDALVTTPYHMQANNIKATSAGNKMTCGMGIGETVSLARQGIALRVGDLWDEVKVMNTLDLIATHYHYEEDIEVDYNYETNVTFKDFGKKVKTVESDYDYIRWHLRGHTPLVFEGAQGVLLDEYWGFPPYNTWTNTLPYNAEQMLWEAGCFDYQKIGVIRAYSTRHGDGPFVAELNNTFIPEDFNGHFGPQGQFRTGNFDGVMYNYACNLAKPDVVALTCIDKISCMNMIRSYEWPDLQKETRLTILHQHRPPSEDVTRDLMEYGNIGYKAPFYGAENMIRAMENTYPDGRVLIESHGDKPSAKVDNRWKRY